MSEYEHGNGGACALDGTSFDTGTSPAVCTTAASISSQNTNGWVGAGHRPKAPHFLHQHGSVVGCG